MNKDFSTLERIMLNMADNLYQPVNFPAYAEKLEKEHAELQAELNSDWYKELTNYLQNTMELSKYRDEVGFTEIEDRLKDELADVLVFILRISNYHEFDAQKLMLHGIQKMVKRVDDPNYNRS